MKLTDMVKSGVNVRVHRREFVAATMNGQDVVVGLIRTGSEQRDAFGEITEADVDPYTSWPFKDVAAPPDEPPQPAKTTKRRARNGNAAS